ncbi:MAG: hypothetical protein WC695_00600 [Candidatus Omnitrophota bacterium]
MFNLKKKISGLFTVILGIFWEAAYAMVIIAIGLLFASAIQYLR